jgi:hypothetical protein
MAKHKEEPVREIPRAERFMQARLRASREAEAVYEATLDPRQKIVPAICQRSGQGEQN